MDNKIINCERCDAPCKVAGPRNPSAKMLRRSEEPKGLCINCAAHDWLRNTYPPNILLAQSGPSVLAHPYIQKQFAAIMRTASADAQPDEIDWDIIIENWNLPFPHKVKSRAMNPCSQRELDEIATGERPGIGGRNPLKHQTVCGPDMCIKSFEQLNELEPGMGDDLRKCLREQNED